MNKTSKIRFIKNSGLTLIFSCFLISNSYTKNNEFDIVVALDGSGDFTTISSAIASLPVYNYERTVIYVKNGIYHEKLRIEQDYITLLGESIDSTIIQFGQLRDDWEKVRDAIGPAVINIYADDVIINNLTVINTQPEIGPHAFCIYGTGTRTILLNCNIKTKGADAVSLWNYKNGMYYHANCHFEGAVDFVCPRGWCYIVNSSFYEVKKSASIWHAGASDESQKFVIKNSSFDGVEGFKLGRHHYEAQFYLINCKFSKNMANVPIYRVTYPDNPEKDRPYFFGNRYYYFNCIKEGSEYIWLKNNLSDADTLLTADKITPEWTFNNQWDPENKILPRLISYSIDSNTVTFKFSEKLSIKGDLTLSTQNGIILKFIMGKGREMLKFSSEQVIKNIDIENGVSVVSGRIFPSEANIYNREIKQFNFK